MEKQKNMPQLRFPDFDGGWERNQLSEIAGKQNNKNSHVIIKDVFTNSATHGVINQRDYFDRDIANKQNLDGYYIIEYDEFVYNPRISECAPVGPISRNLIGTGVMSPLYTVFRFKSGNLDFFEQYFNSTKWHKYLKSVANYGARYDRMNLTNSDFFSLPIFLPSSQEQQKIASFLPPLTAKYSQLKRKKTLLEQYKKGVMQKIFTLQIRFKDKNGQEFPKWEKRKLGDVGKTYNGLTGKTKVDFGQGKPYIQYKQIFDDTRIDISRFDFVRIRDGEKQCRVRYGDVFFTTSSETPDEVGTSSVLLDEVSEVYLNSFCFGYRSTRDVLIPQFSRYLFRNELLRNEINKLAQGSTRYNISKNELMKTVIELPSIQEQAKIANFLSALDDKILHTQKQVEKAVVWKKGLMQQMFC